MKTFIKELHVLTWESRDPKKKKKTCLKVLKTFYSQNSPILNCFRKPDLNLKAKRIISLLFKKKKNT